MIRDSRSGLSLMLDYDGVRQALHDAEVFSSAVSAPERAPGRWLIFAGVVNGYVKARAAEVVADE